jgi:hypothetical protein
MMDGEIHTAVSAAREWLVTLKARRLRVAAYEDGRRHGVRGSLKDPVHEAYPFHKDWERGYRDGLQTHGKRELSDRAKAHADRVGYLGARVSKRVVPSCVRGTWVKSRREASRRFTKECE